MGHPHGHGGSSPSRPHMIDYPHGKAIHRIVHLTIDMLHYVQYKYVSFNGYIIAKTSFYLPDCSLIHAEASLVSIRKNGYNHDHRPLFVNSQWSYMHLHLSSCIYVDLICYKDELDVIQMIGKLI